MARKSNDLFIGADRLNIEGRDIKHPALIKHYATVNLNKISDDPISLIGMDLETNSNDGTLMLLGFYNNLEYNHYYKDDFIDVLFTWVKYAYRSGKALTYWNRLDPFVLYKQFLLKVTDPKVRQFSMEKFSKVSGEWNKDTMEWDIKPIIELKMNGGYYFGIRNAIRSNIQFYFRRENNENLHLVWAYDIAQLYQNGLELTALGKLDKETNTYPYARLPYYTKGDKDLHLVDWDRFENDTTYHKRVLGSNELDSRAVHDLGIIIQEEFKNAFNFYPKTLISQGSIARAGIVATLSNIHNGNKEKIAEDIKSIGIQNYDDEWHTKYGEDFVKDLSCLFFEAYSGGQIEAYMYGYTKEAYTTDLTQAYPYNIEHLWDLRNAKITKGTGTPPRIENSYCLLRGDVNIPRGIDYHPLTIKHPLHNLRETNIRATGKYRASYYLEERDYLISLGATFKNEEWYNIETTGKLSPLAKVCKVFTDLRAKLIPSGKDYIAKISSASLYGILFEAVHTWEEEGFNVLKAGYRGGEFLNPLYAGIITMKTRLQVSKTANEIKANGGKPILIMTDSIFWQGSADMVDPSMIRYPKTVGYYENVSKIDDFLCLGSGRYGYTNDDGYVQSKKRGLNAVDIHDPDGIIVGDFNWLNALKIMKRKHTKTIQVKVRKLISVGVVCHTNILENVIVGVDKHGKDILENIPITHKDLGRIVEVLSDVEIIVGRSKRLYDDDIKDPSLLAQGLLETEATHIEMGMLGDDKEIDQTLPELRKLLMLKHMTTRKEKRKGYQKTATQNYYNKNNDKIKSYRKGNYEYLKQYGYDSKQRNKMQSWSLDKIQQQLMEDGKL